MMIGLGFRACVFGSLLRDERGCITGLSSLPYSESGYSLSPSVADVRSNKAHLPKQLHCRSPRWKSAGAQEA
jgi:hypothetical protein